MSNSKIVISLIISIILTVVCFFYYKMHRSPFAEWEQFDQIELDDGSRKTVGDVVRMIRNHKFDDGSGYEIISSDSEWHFDYELFSDMPHLDAFKKGYKVDLQSPYGKLEINLGFNLGSRGRKAVYETYFYCKDEVGMNACCPDVPGYPYNSSTSTCFFDYLRLSSKKKTIFKQSFLNASISRYPDQKVSNILRLLDHKAAALGYQLEGKYIQDSVHIVEFRKEGDFLTFEFMPIDNMYYTKLKTRHYDFSHRRAMKWIKEQS